MNYSEYIIGGYLIASIGLSYVLYKNEKICQREEIENREIIPRRNDDNESFLESMTKDFMDFIKSDWK